MFVVIYRFKLKPYQEVDYQAYWHTVATYFLKERAALGSCLHRGADGLWLAYSRWPDRKTRDSAWPGDQCIEKNMPETVREAMQKMQVIKLENQEEGHYEEICLDVVEDLLGLNHIVNVC